jgi:D-tyrosyl-tRNA(Tyr) deacylase
MRAVVQRVRLARVTVGKEVAAEIGPGLLILVGVARSDTEADCAYVAGKIAGLRVFEDGEGKMNRSVGEAGAAVLLVSQFTLYGDVRRGKRPSFDAAAEPQQAKLLYERLAELIGAAGVPCATGRFRETMEVELINHGPVTILIDSQKTF